MSDSNEVEKRDGELLQLSWVPIFRGWLSGDIRMVADHAKRLRKESQGVALSNRGGWQSHNLLADFQTDPHLGQVLAQLESMLRSFVETYKTLESTGDGSAPPFEIEICNLWANLNDPGNWNAAHHHPGAHISGVFYAQAPKDCGDLMLRPPYSFFDVVLDQVDQPSIRPEPGMVVLFPSDVFHSIEPNRGSEERISFAFNARYRPITPSGQVFL